MAKAVLWLLRISPNLWMVFSHNSWVVAVFSVCMYCRRLTGRRRQCPLPCRPVWNSHSRGIPARTDSRSAGVLSHVDEPLTSVRTATRGPDHLHDSPHNRRPPPPAHLADSPAVDPGPGDVGAVPAAQPVAGRGGDLAGGPAARPRDLAHAGAGRRRTRALLPADARTLRMLRARHDDAAAALRAGHGGGGGLCDSHRPATGRDLGWPGGGAVARPASGGAVLSPGGAPVRTGHGRGRDLDAAAGDRARGPWRNSAVGGLRRLGPALRAAELAGADDPARARGDPDPDAGPARGVDPLDGGLGGGRGGRAAPDPVLPEPVRTGGYRR